MEMVLGGPQEAEAFLGNFKVTRTVIAGCWIIIVLCRCAHTRLCVLEGVSELSPENH